MQPPIGAAGPAPLELRPLSVHDIGEQVGHRILHEDWCGENRAVAAAPDHLRVQGLWRRAPGGVPHPHGDVCGGLPVGRYGRREMQLGVVDLRFRLQVEPQREEHNLCRGEVRRLRRGVVLRAVPHIRCRVQHRQLDLRDLPSVLALQRPRGVLHRGGRQASAGAPRGGEVGARAAEAGAALGALCGDRVLPGPAALVPQPDLLLRRDLPVASPARRGPRVLGRQARCALPLLRLRPLRRLPRGRFVLRRHVPAVASGEGEAMFE
mmetsp:Transcript_87290/g.244359  ORF Transcript_87290/g.244359 Transcript_87290/m.244359 type:complete len:265 (-) Transcript_87290:134-928(-)